MAEPHEPAWPPVPREPRRDGPAAGGAEDGRAHGVHGQPVEWPRSAPGIGPDGGGPWQPGYDGGQVGRALRNPLPPAEMSRRALAIELLAMFVLAFAVPILGLFSTSQTSVPTDLFAFSVLASAAIQWFPIGILFFLLRRHGGWSSIGLTPIEPIDFMAGVVLWLTSHVTVLILAMITRGLGTNDVEFLPPGLPVWELATLSVVIAATAGLVEEILVRGYAQTRLQQLRAPAVIVVVVPTAIWAVLHIYQGIGPALAIFGLGLVYAIWFQWTRRLWPVVIAHGLFDLSTLALIIVATTHR